MVQATEGSKILFSIILYLWLSTFAAPTLRLQCLIITWLMYFIVYLHRAAQREEPHGLCPLSRA